MYFIMAQFKDHSLDLEEARRAYCIEQAIEVVRGSSNVGTIISYAQDIEKFLIGRPNVKPKA